MNKRFKVLLQIFVVFCFLLVLSCDDDNNSTKPKLMDDPTFSISPGVYYSVIHVGINSSTEDVQIYYTRDGSEPTELSHLYTEPVTIVTTTTLKARAFKNNYQPSTVISGKYWMSLASVETPTFTPEPGSYSEEQNVTLDCLTLDADIYYTLDGTEPNASSLMYDSLIFISSDTTIKARAFKEYHPASEIAVGEYEITTPIVASPTFNPTPGVYDLDQSITIQCYTPGAEIHYTTDGSAPTSDSPLFSEAIYVNTDTTIKAFASKDGYLSSAITTGIYVISYQVVAIPEFTPEAGDFLGAQSVTITSATPDATIYYTLDGNEPTESSLLYSDAIELTSITTIKARGYKNDYIASEIAVGDFNIFSETISAPVFDPPPGDYVGQQSITLSSSTPGVEIYYTVNDIDPTESSILYNGPITLHTSKVIKVRAYSDEYYQSEIVVGNYLIGNPNVEDFVLVEGGTFNNGTADVTLRSFYIGKYELTQAEYQMAMGFNPSYDIVPWDDYGLGGDYPVYGVSWYEAVMYCNARSFNDGLASCYDPTDWSCDFTANGWRLPTEMEWMYAAKGGNQQPSSGYNIYSGTDSQSELPLYAWFDFNGGFTSYPVGSKLPNQLGIYDMSGNVNEWCWDRWYYEYPPDPQTNPTGPETGTHRLLRGGSWESQAPDCMVIMRTHDYPDESNEYLIGFRMVRKLPD